MDETSDMIDSATNACLAPQSDLPRVSQRMRKTTERYKSWWNPRLLSCLEQTIDGLSRRQKFHFAELQGAMSPETISLLGSFLKRNKDDYPVPPTNSRISIIPHDIWDGNMTRSKKQMLEHYLRPPKASPEASATTPEEVEVATINPPHIAFAPYSHQGSWVMIMFMTTSSSCRAEVVILTALSLQRMLSIVTAVFLSPT